MGVGMGSVGVGQVGENVGVERVWGGESGEGFVGCGGGEGGGGVLRGLASFYWL